MPHTTFDNNSFKFALHYKLRSFLYKSLILASRCVYLVLKPFFMFSNLVIYSRKYRLVFNANSPLYAQYLFRLVEVLQSDSNIKCYITCKNKYAEVIEAAKKRKFRYLPYWLSIVFSWDIAFFCSPNSVKDYPRNIPKIRFSYFISCTKFINGEHWVAAPRFSMDKGVPIFSCIFVASETEKQEMIKVNPAIKNIIAVVGDIKAEHLLKNMSKREAVRYELGFNPNDIVVLIQSTHGENSLMATMGREIIHEAKKLHPQSSYKFMFSLHPNYWSGHANTPLLGPQLQSSETEGLLILNPDIAWERYMVAADLCISDHTGNALSFALLEEPMIFISLKTDEVASRQLLNIYESSIHLEHSKDLKLKLDEAYSYLNSPLKYPLNKLLSFQGRSADRIRTEVYRILTNSNSR